MSSAQFVGAMPQRQCPTANSTAAQGHYAERDGLITFVVSRRRSVEPSCRYSGSGAPPPLRAAPPARCAWRGASRR